MASNYPGSLDSFDTIASDKKMSDAVGGRTHRAILNDMGDAIEAVQGELGTDPAGGSATVKARFEVIEANDWVTADKIAANAVGSSELADNAVDTAAIQDAAVTAAKLAVQPGNLLTDNQASGTDTLADTTGFAAQVNGGTLTSVWDAFGSGSRSVKCAVTGAAFQGVLVQNAPAYAGVTMTFQATVRVSVTGTYRWGAYSAAAGVNTLTEGTITSGSWVTLQHTFTPTATASDMDLVLLDTTVAGGITGDIYLDQIGLWKGSGGLWAMPGEPIRGQSRIAVNNAVDLSGTGTPEGVVTAAPGSTWLQTGDAVTVSGNLLWRKISGTGDTGWEPEGALADTGWRDVSSLLLNGWAAGGAGMCLVRRIGRQVNWLFQYINGASATNDVLLAPPAGFRTNYGISVFRAGNVVGAFNVRGTPQIDTSLRDAAIYVDMTHTTDNAWPSSLPGTAA